MNSSPGPKSGVDESGKKPWKITTWLGGFMLHRSGTIRSDRGQHGGGSIRAENVCRCAAAPSIQRVEKYPSKRSTSPRCFWTHTDPPRSQVKPRLDHCFRLQQLLRVQLPLRLLPLRLRLRRRGRLAVDLLWICCCCCCRAGVGGEHYVK
jgi:hypothetical protein